MRTLVMLTLIILYHILQKVSSGVIQCISVVPPTTSTISTWSASGDGDRKEITCENTGYATLVSCGFETKDSSEGSFEGSWMQTFTDGRWDKCVASNANNGAGVRPHARCCNFAQTVDCAAHDASGNNVADNSDELSILQCPAHTIMLGCTGHEPFEFFDGTWVGVSDPTSIIGNFGTGPGNPYPMQSYCTAQNGNHQGTKANINCCSAQGLGLQCNIYYNSAGSSNTLSCPSGTTMMTCNGKNHYQTTNAWYIDSSGRCVTRSRNSEVTYTSAICCNEVTKAPTKSPSKRPTRAPTNNPSITPTSRTSAPSTPTEIPTQSPTRTRKPSESPTTPTDTPSSSPSSTPTISSDTPSNAPSTSPTAAPSRKTRDPTRIPTAEPSGRGGGSFNDTKNKNNETLFLVLFIVFGILFCCLLGGIAYWYFKNKKQKDEVDYNNEHAHAAVAQHSPYNKPAKNEEDDDQILDGVNNINMEGAKTTKQMQGGTNSTLNIVDASVGIKTTSGDTLTPENQQVKEANARSYSAGIDGMSDNDEKVDKYKLMEEDDQKSDVFKVSM